MNFPTTPPGLQGDYRESCIVCLRGTDTAIGFKGAAEWAIAGLLNLGIPQDQAMATVSYGTGNDPGEVPAGEVCLAFRVCAECAQRARLPVGLIPDKVPVIVPDEERD